MVWQCKGSYFCCWFDWIVWLIGLTLALATATVVDCPTQLTLIFMILIFVFVSCFMTNIKSANMKKHSREICYPQPRILNPSQEDKAKLRHVN